MRRSLTASLIIIVLAAAAFLGGTLLSGNSPKLGLDLQGGASVVLTPQKGTTVKPGTLQQAIKIIRLRVNGLGVSEADVNQQGNNIVVELPGVKDQDRALNLVGQTAQLEFRHVLQVFPAGGVYDPVTGTTVPPGGSSASASSTTSTTTSTSSTTGSTSSTAPASTSTTGGASAPPTSAPPTSGALGAPRVEAAGAAQAQPAQVSPSTTGATASTASPATTATPLVPTTVPATAPTATSPPLTPRDQLSKDKQIVVPELKPGTNDITAEYLLDKAELSGDVVSSANAEVSQNLGEGWDVKVNFTGSGSTAFDNLAKKYYQSQVAIVLDGVVESAPTINAQQFNGTAIISGNSANGGFTHKQSSDLALVLRYGSLPVQLTQSTVQKVSATLGRDSLRAGLLAGVIGLGLVLLYMILYYRALGLVVVAGLTVSGALLWTIVSYLGEKHGLTLTLAGATGIIVSVGVTVDSYIVYFERLKDEIRTGRTIRSSVDRGFSRAWRTIVSADAVSFIGAALLWLLTVGPVRGFAFFLGLSTLLDLLVAYTFTRPMVVLLGRNPTFTENRIFGVARGLAATPAGGSS